MVQWLVVEEGADPNPVDRHQRTPLEVRPFAHAACLAFESSIGLLCMSSSLAVIALCRKLRGMTTRRW